ncbi:hypothetical protein D3C80_633530 [compost metagenome]
MLVELDGVVHAAIFRLLFRQSHCHTHVNELRRLEDVTLSTEAVLQGVLLIDVLTTEMWVGLVFLVGNDLLQFSVLCFGIVEQIHVAHLGEFEVQLTDGWYTLRECTFGDQRGIQLTCHQVVSPGFTTQGDVNQLFLEFLGGQYRRTLVDCIEENTWPVNPVTQFACGPLTPLRSLFGHEGFSTLVEFDHLSNHGSKP